MSYSSLTYNRSRLPGLKYQVKDGVVNREIMVHLFEVYSDDPVVAAGSQLYEWQKSESGKWVMEHTVETPRWERFRDPHTFCDMFMVIARLSEPDITFWTLKYL